MLFQYRGEFFLYFEFMVEMNIENGKLYFIENKIFYMFKKLFIFSLIWVVGGF